MAITIVGSFRIMREGELLGARARVGGVAFSDGETHIGQLSLAEKASQIAADKLGRKLHIWQDPRDVVPFLATYPQAVTQDLH